MSPRIPRRSVHLPWAPQLPAPKGHGASDEILPSAPARRPAAPRDRPPCLDARALAPELRAAGLPYSPPPALPETDRSPVTREELVRAAIALDVLGTELGRIEPGSAVLHSLTSALSRVGELGGHDGAALEGLVRFAEGEAGVDRALVSRELAACTALARGEDRLPLPSTPESIAAALAQIREAARLVVLDATLALQAEPLVDYRRS